MHQTSQNIGGDRGIRRRFFHFYCSFFEIVLKFENQKFLKTLKISDLFDFGSIPQRNKRLVSASVKITDNYKRDNVLR